MARPTAALHKASFDICTFAAAALWLQYGCKVLIQYGYNMVIWLQYGCKGFIHDGVAAKAASDAALLGLSLTARPHLA